MSGDWLAMGAVAALAAAGMVKGRAGSRTVNAFQGLRDHMGGHYGQIEDYYPETAAGQLQQYRGTQVYWVGANGGRYGVSGPTDGSMVPVDARYLEPMPGNIWDFDKLSALVGAIEQGRDPIVHPGYAAFNVVMNRGAVEQTEESAQDIADQSFAMPYENRDVGALTAMVRDGNHRSFAGLIAGADVAWVLLSDNDKQDLHERRGNRRIDRIYTEIRRAQKAHGVPLFTRPRLKRARHVEGLAQAQAQMASYEQEIPRLQRLLLTRYDDGGGNFRGQQHERPGLFLRLLFGRIQEQQGADRFISIFQQDADYIQLRQSEAAKRKLSNRLITLRQAAGLDWRTGERAYR